MAISGHRSEQSLAHYNTRPSTSQVRNLSEVLPQSLVTSTPESSSTGITVRQNNSVVVAQEKTASFLESVFSNCTMHGNINHILPGLFFASLPSMFTLSEKMSPCIVLAILDASTRDACFRKIYCMENTHSGLVPSENQACPSGTLRWTDLELFGIDTSNLEDTSDDRGA